MTKVCSKCKVAQPLTNFHKDSSKADGLNWWCKTCAKSARQARESTPVGRQKKAEAIRAWKLNNLYGISVEEYNAMLEEQGGLCYICKTAPTDKMLSVDHCHETGAVRKLLCNDCNLMLGNAHDNPEVLIAAASYLIEQGVRV